MISCGVTVSIVVQVLFYTALLFLIYIIELKRARAFFRNGNFCKNTARQDAECAWELLGGVGALGAQLL